MWLLFSPPPLSSSLSHMSIPFRPTGWRSRTWRGDLSCWPESSEPWWPSKVRPPEHNTGPKLAYSTLILSSSHFAHPVHKCTSAKQKLFCWQAMMTLYQGKPATPAGQWGPAVCWLQNKAKHDGLGVVFLRRTPACLGSSKLIGEVSAMTVAVSMGEKWGKCIKGKMCLGNSLQWGYMNWHQLIYLCSFVYVFAHYSFILTTTLVNANSCTLFMVKGDHCVYKLKKNF